MLRTVSYVKDCNGEDTLQITVRGFNYWAPREDVRPWRNSKNPKQQDRAKMAQGKLARMNKRSHYRASFKTALSRPVNRHVRHNSEKRVSSKKATVAACCYPIVDIRTLKAAAAANVAKNTKEETLSNEGKAPSEGEVMPVDEETVPSEEVLFDEEV